MTQRKPALDSVGDAGRFSSETAPSLLHKHTALEVCLQVLLKTLVSADLGHLRLQAQPPFPAVAFLF